MHRPSLLLNLIAVALMCCAAGPASVSSAETAPIRVSTATGPLRLAIIGMTHDHVGGLLRYASRHPEQIRLVGVYEPNREVFDKRAAAYEIDPALYHGDLAEMLEQTRPEAVSVMTSVKDHRLAVEACAPRGIHVMLEKPLAYSNEDAKRIAELAHQNGVLVMTNYETSWYASVREAKRLIDSGQMSPVRRIIFRTGHQGPKEIGCSADFLAWLTDPVGNGGGALVDFGCYGAITSTWLMNGQRPTKIVASATTLKPDVYPKVDDDATIVLTYPTATTVIQASWAWTHDVKEMDVYTEKGSIHAGKGDELSLRDPNKPPRTVKPTTKPADLENTWVYFQKVVRGQCDVDPMSSLDMNLIAVEILDAARTAVKR